MTAHAKEVVLERDPVCGETIDPGRASTQRPMGIEAARIDFLVARDGKLVTRDWVKRTLITYRRAVLDPRHFASTGEYRPRFLASCLDFRRWLRKNRQ